MNTFVRKVKAERRVLAVINSVTPGSQQLTGLSSAAIESWRRKAGIVGADRIADRLLEIGVLCQCLSDRSNESFQSLDPTLVAQINDKLRALAAEMGTEMPLV